MVDASVATGRKLSIQLSSLFSKETKAARRLIDAGGYLARYIVCLTAFK